MPYQRLPRGIVSVLQTPFDGSGRIDKTALVRLVHHAIEGGVDGFLAPVVASEVDMLTRPERADFVHVVINAIEKSSRHVPLIVGASSGDVEECVSYAADAEAVGASAYLVAVPATLYTRPDEIVTFFRAVGAQSSLPLVVQDLQFSGPGMDIDTIRRLRDAVPTLVGLKVETVPAGPKYTEAREAFGDEFWTAGGWAVPQMIEALDRGVDAMIPESSMIPVYHAIDQAYRTGNRAQAISLFREILPVLSYTNQDLLTSITFFKRLLVRKGIFRNEYVRKQGFVWDRYNECIADELIEHYLALESKVGAAQ